MPAEDFDYGELLVLRHHPDCGLAGLAPMLEGRAGRRPHRIVDVPEEGVPELTEELRGILALGGPMGVHDGAAWMGDEAELLAAATFADIPVFGICLGAQLLASGLGGTVRTLDTPEVRIAALSRTAGAEEDTVFAGWPDGASVLLTHRDAVRALPDGAVEMLEGAGAHVAWRTSQGGGYGVQFHPEIGADEITVWTEQPDLASLFTDAGIDPEEFVELLRNREAFIRAAGLSLVGRWVDEVVGAEDPVIPK